MLGNFFKIEDIRFGIFRFNKYLFVIFFVIFRFVRERRIFFCFLIIFIFLGEFSFFIESYFFGLLFFELVIILLFW